MEKIQTSRKTMRAVEEKLVFNKCWPKFHAIALNILHSY